MKLSILPFKKLLITLIIVLKINEAIANEAIVIPQGKPAPYTGLLIPETKAIELYNDIHKYRLLTESYERSITLYKSNEELLEKKIGILNEYNQSLSESLSKSKTTSNLEKAAWFALGFISVMAGAYAIKTTNNITN